MASAEENLKRALSTRAKRVKIYKDAHIRFGAVMKALYPEGILLRTEQDFARYGTLTMVVGKLVRYTTYPELGHPDSAHDLIVYAAMLEEQT